MRTAAWVVALLVNVIPVPTPLISQNGSSTVTSKDRRSGWKAEWGMEQLEVQGRKVVRFTEKGTGRLSAYSQEVHWSTTSTWLASKAFLPLDTERTVTSEDGKVLLEEKKHFDREKNTVTLEHLEPGEPAENKSVEISEDTLAVEGLAGVLRFATIDKTHPLSAHVLTNDLKLYSVSFEWRQEERIHTPAGEFECYKVEMVPHLGVLNMLRPFLPRAYFWFTKAAPHYWVRYQGPESGQGTPDVVMELSSTSH